MRGSDVVDLITDLLPRGVRRTLGRIVLLVLISTGTFGPVVLWYVEDKQAGIMEGAIAPAMDPVIEGLISKSTP